MCGRPVYGCFASNSGFKWEQAICKNHPFVVGTRFFFSLMQFNSFQTKKLEATMAWRSLWTPVVSSSSTLDLCWMRDWPARMTPTAFSTAKDAFGGSKLFARVLQAMAPVSLRTPLGRNWLVLGK